MHPVDQRDARAVRSHGDELTRARLDILHLRAVSARDGLQLAASERDPRTVRRPGRPAIVALVGESSFVLRQLFARDYTEERALLSELGRLLADVDFLVTFNGKSFDVPFLRDRAIHHRLSLTIEIPQLDLLWMARRRWKSILPDCKLKTLEWHVLRKRRAGDVWGFEIPGLYHDYVQNGEPHRLIPVFHHNMLDVIAMMELIPAIFDPETAVY